ncbi:MAG: hypothetical protein E6713_15725 [Sporomusaceae bacterium]|nr:hypothetical protein [Sporomusaceae bacterium]
MNQRHLVNSLVVSTLIAVLLTAGCDLGQAPKKPEIGPTGSGETTKTNPPFWQRFEKPPQIFYDLEPTGGILFEKIKQKNWSAAALDAANLRHSWENTKLAIGAKKGVGEADEALEKLNQAITAQNSLTAYEALNEFFSALSDAAKSYKFSPLADLLQIGNAARSVNYYVADKDWSKAAAKAQELEQTWEQNKPSLEMMGILGKVTQTHSTIKGLRDAVGGENQGQAESLLKNLNESLANIRDFYKNK